MHVVFLITLKYLTIHVKQSQGYRNTLFYPETKLSYQLTVAVVLLKLC